MTMQIKENLDTPVVSTHDVIVVGGGPAGVGAALAAARGGSNTLLVESYGFLGGMWTMGMVNPIFDYENKGGICQEIHDRIEAAGMGVRNGPDIWNFDVESMKRLLDQMAREAGVHLLYHTAFSRPVLTDDAVQGIIVENKGGRSAYLAKVVIDCTGDGDIAMRAGAPYGVGRDKDGKAQPMTLMFRMSNVGYTQDYYRFRHYEENELIGKIDDALARAGIANYPFNYRRPCILKVPGCHTALCQVTHIRGRCAIDPADLTEAEIEGRQLVEEFFHLLKSYVPGFECAQLDTTGPHIGIRESRHINGEYYLTLDDVRNHRRFEDGICTSTFWVDIHQPDGDNQEKQHNETLQTNFQIPYRCLIPLKVDGLLMAGRCISGSHEAHASFRVTGDCVAMGQAAGTAAALCVKSGLMPRALDGRAVVAQMIRDGAICNAG